MDSSSDKNLKNYWVPLLTLFILVIGLATTILLTKGQQKIITKATGSNSSIDLPTSLSIPVNQTFTVPVMINNDNAEIIAADVILNFDKNYLQLSDITPNTAGSGFTVFLPYDSSHNFAKALIVQEANLTGKIQFSALCYLDGPCFQGLKQPLTAQNPLALLQFKGIQSGNTSVNLMFLSQGSTSDSSLVERTNGDILGHVANLSLSILAQAPSVTPASTSTPTPTSIPTLTPSPIIVGNGLMAQYYSYKKLNNPFDQSLLARTDSTINFSWLRGSPDPKIPVDKFSVRWTGKLIAPVTNTYTIYAKSDDGVRVWINNQLVINRWVNQAATEVSGVIVLTGGVKNDIKVEYYEASGNALVQLSWSSSSLLKQIIPSQQLYVQ